MNNTLIYINGELADLLPDTVVATTFQSMSIGDITARSVSFTNQIKLPKTPANQRLFQFADNPQSNTQKPYVIMDVKVVSEGLEIVRGVGFITDAKDGRYTLEIYETLKTFVDKIKDKYVDELDFGFYAALVQVQKEEVTPGAPVIDYGRMLIPEEQIVNNDFNAAIFQPWENIDSDPGVAWAAEGSQIGVELAASAPNHQSKTLRTPYKLYRGYSYRIILVLHVLGGTTGTLTLKLITPGSAEQAVGGADISSNGNVSIDETVLCLSLFEEIHITCEQSVGVSSKTVTLKRILIIPDHRINILNQFYLPVIGYHDIIKKIVEEAGYVWDNRLASADLAYLNRLAITFSKDKLRYTKRLTDRYEFRALCPGNQVISADNSGYKRILFTDVRLNGAEELFNPSTSMYEVPEMDINLEVRLHVKLVVNIPVLSSPVTIRLYNGTTWGIYFIPDTLIGIGDTISTPGQHVVEFVSDPRVIGSNAEDYGVGMTATDSTEVQILSGVYHAEVNDKPVGSRRHLSNLVLPDMRQSEFFADFLYRFGLMFSQQGSTVSVYPLEKALADTEHTVDWSSKRDLSGGEQVVFLAEGYDNYAQSNYFSDGDDLDSRGTIVATGNKLEKERTLYTSPFVAPEYITVKGTRIVRVPVFDFESDDRWEVSSEFEPGVRLIYLRDPLTSDPEVKYVDAIDTEHYVAVYNDPLSPHRADWQYLVDRYYNQLQNILDAPKTVVRYYRLNAIDIAKLDLTRLVYDDGAYYLINRIENYVPGFSTKVELVKVGGAKVDNPLFDQDYQNILDYAISQSYTLPSAGQQEKHIQFIQALKAAGIWEKLDLLYVFAVDGDSDFARINWIAPGTFPAQDGVVGPLFTVNQGFTGDGSTSYLDTGWVPANDAVYFQQGDASIFTGINNDLGADSLNTALGSLSTSGGPSKRIQLIPCSDTNAHSAALNSGLLAGGPSPGTDGFFHFQRQASDYEFWRDGSQAQASLSGNTDLSDVSMFLLGMNNNGSLNTPGAFQMSVFGLGASLAGKEAALYNAWNAYFSSL